MRFREEDNFEGVGRRASRCRGASPRRPRRPPRAARTAPGERRRPARAARHHATRRPARHARDDPRQRDRPGAAERKPGTARPRAATVRASARVRRERQAERACARRPRRHVRPRRVSLLHQPRDRDAARHAQVAERLLRRATLAAIASITERGRTTRVDFILRTRSGSPPAKVFWTGTAACSARPTRPARRPPTPSSRTSR
jgi:hypothetical protein